MRAEAMSFYRIFSFGSCKDNPAFTDNNTVPKKRLTAYE